MGIGLNYGKSYEAVYAGLWRFMLLIECQNGDGRGWVCAA